MPNPTPRTRPRNGIPASPPRIIIEHVAPAVDGGRYPAKRLPGDAVTVTAIVYREGHEFVTGRVRYRPPGERRWRYAPMTYARDFDRLTGTFVVDRTGVWTFGVEAWTDRFGTWQADLVKRVDAAQDLAEDLREGAALVDPSGLGGHRVFVFAR